MPNIRGPELLILVLVIVLLFGAKRLPDAARSVGRSLRIFKAETKGLVDGEVAPDSADASAAANATPEAPAAPAALPPAQQAPVAGTSAVPAGDAPAADHALAPQAEPSAPSLQSQPPSQA
jgi:sec-independent protein translocase protein TatA